MNKLVLSNPVLLLIELTNKCSHNCFGCGNVFEKETNKFIDVDFLREFIPQLKNIVFDIRLTGGEPTLHPQFENILEIINEAGISFSILSNANWYNIDNVLEKLEGKDKFRGFLISLHGDSKEMHDKFVNIEGSFDNVTKNIKELTSKGIYVSTNTIINKDTVTKIKEISNLSHSIGANYAVFNRYYGAHANYSIDNHSLKNAVEKITKLRKAGQMIRLGNCTPLCFANCDSDGCPGGNSVATIDPWLNLRPCNHATITAGNLRELSLPDIWKSEKMTEWRNLIPSECTNCVYINNCGGGCRAEALFYGTKKDPLINSTITTPIYDNGALLNLYQNQTFKSSFIIRKENFGYLLFNEGEVVLVNEDSKELLEDLKNENTVDMIKQKHGNSSLDIISELLLRGFILYN